MSLLSSPRLPEQHLLIRRYRDLQQIPLIAAAIHTRSTTGGVDQAELRARHLKRIHELRRRDVPRIKQQHMTRNAEQGLGVFLDAGQQKILDILRAENDEDSFWRTRFMPLRMYSIATILVR